MLTDEITENYALQIGKNIKNFTFNTYNPALDRFEENSFARIFAEKKWLVIFFYPADFTFVCPTELADLASYHDEFIRLGVEVVSFSTDTHFSHLAWCKAETLLKDVKFQMGSDPTGAISQFFGVYDEKEGTTLRGTFIVNPDGVLVGSEINYYNVGRNAAELVRKMQANNYLRTRPNEACPAKWHEGAQTLTPSESLVGCVGDFLSK